MSKDENGMTYKPSKRVRNWHRKSGSAEPLKQFARRSIKADMVGAEAWRDWIRNKAA